MVWLLSYTATFGLLFTAPLMLASAYHLASGHSGLVLTLLPVALGVTAPLAGRLADRWGAPTVTATGMGVATIGLVGIAVGRPGLGVFAALLVVVGVGLGLLTPANNAAVMAAAPPRFADDRLSGTAGTDDRGGDLDAFVLLPHRLGPRESLARAADHLLHRKKISFGAAAGAADALALPGGPRRHGRPGGLLPPGFQVPRRVPPRRRPAGGARRRSPGRRLPRERPATASRPSPPRPSPSRRPA